MKYDGKWWGAKILLVHRGKSKGYKVKYYDEKGCEQSNVPAENIRELVDIDVDDGNEGDVDSSDGFDILDPK